MGNGLKAWCSRYRATKPNANARKLFYSRRPKISRLSTHRMYANVGTFTASLVSRQQRDSHVSTGL